MEGLANVAGHEDRHAPLKNYCKGLLLPGERKSIEPIAARLDAGNVQPMRQSLHHLVAKAAWSDETLLDEVRKRVLPAMQKQGPLVAWIVDDTGFQRRASTRSGSLVNTTARWVSRRTAVLL
jgi:SRSO17 transposase